MCTLSEMSTAGDVRITVTPLRRGPVRSRGGGLALIVLSPFIAFAILGLAELHRQQRGDGRFLVFGAIFGLAAGTWAVTTGLRMRLRDGWDVLRRDPRPPVIFLRPFLEDERVRYNSPVGKRIGADVPKADAVGKVTTEPKIGRTLRSIGPFVAVGKPGQWLASFGAARIYLDDHEWQDTVAFLTAKAMAIVLQPDERGTLWELELTVQRVDPRRILMLVPNAGLRPLGFERVRRLTGQVLPVPLPANIACDAFMFDERWIPRALQFGKKPQSALREFIDQVRQLTIPQEQIDAFADFVGTIRR